MKSSILVVALLSVAVAGCASSRKADDRQVEGDLMTALKAVAGQMELSAKPQQEAFERTIVPGLTKDEVVQKSAAIAAEAEKESRERKYTTSTVQVTSSGDLICFKGGRPDSMKAAGDGGEVWSYKCYHTTYRVAFDSDRVADVEKRED